MEKTPQTIIEKIQKLQALADRAGTEHEAALAAQKVAELCEQHNLDIGVATLTQEETSATEAMHTHDSSRWAAHWSDLSSACGKMFTVGHYRKPVGIVVKDSSGTVVGKKDGQALVFYGLKANVAAATVTYEYYLASVESLLEGYIREGHSVFGASQMRSFRLGCASRINDEVAKVIQVKQQLIKATEESQALVRLENQLIKAHATKMHLRAGHGYSGARSRDHYQAGYSAGARVDIRGARTSRMIRGD